MTIDTLRPVSRRGFLKLAGALGVCSVAADLGSQPAWMPRLAFAPPGVEPQGDILVAVFQRGGMDGLNAVIPHGDPDYYRLRRSLAIGEPAAGHDNTGIDLDGFFGLHPALRPLKDLWDDQALAIVHAVGSPDPTHSHFDAMDYMERGTPGEKQLATGWIGRHLQTAPWQNTSAFRAIGMGSIMQASLRGPVPVTTLQSIADYHLKGRTKDLGRIQETLASLYGLGSGLDEAGASTFAATDVLAGIDISNYTPANGAAYPEGPFGMACRQVAQIIKAEIGMEVACIDIGGWDTHNAQGGLEGAMPNLLADLAGGLAALYHDLGDTAKRVTFVTMSEFGRRAYENGSQGTDHGHGNVMFVAGGGIRGGKVYGEWPGLAKDQLYSADDLAVTTDFRDVLGELVQK
ncbi:MAG: DUF1501 domain-containing protein, partial [Anaerolineales bacterium]